MGPSENVYQMPSRSVDLALSCNDEAILRAYFHSYRPSAPGAKSNFGAVATRKGSAINPRTIERPTPGTPWTEILDCGHGGGATNFDGEEAMLAYIDGRRWLRRVGAAVESLSTRDQDVLDAYYGSEPSNHPLGPIAPVIALTEAARARNRGRAARGLHEPIETTVRWLATLPGNDARTATDDMRREANEMLRGARANFARAHAATNGRRS
jgi:hypothetical protein